MSCLVLPTAADVQAVVSTGSLTEAQIDEVISDAALIAETCIESLDGNRQRSILKWLAAHLISTIKSQGGGALTSDRIGDAARSYSTASLGTELRSTSYGQQALLLDPNGCLARLGKARAVFEGL